MTSVRCSKKEILIAESEVPSKRNTKTFKIDKTLGMLGFDGQHSVTRQVEAAIPLKKLGASLHAKTFVAKVKGAFALPQVAPVLA